MLPIHQSAWKRNSANFAFWAFSEVDQEFIGNSSPPASMDGRSNPAGVARVKERVLMRRILLVLAVGAIMVLSSVSYAFAEANPDNNGNAANAPGQVNAETNCDNVIETQEGSVEAGGGPKAGTGEAPTNCDHFFQEE